MATDAAEEVLRLYLETLRFGLSVSKDLFRDVTSFLRFRAKRLAAQKAKDSVERLLPKSRSLEVLRLKEKDFRKFRKDADKSRLWYLALSDLADAEHAINIVIQKASEDRVQKILNKYNLDPLPKSNPQKTEPEKEKTHETDKQPPSQEAPEKESQREPEPAAPDESVDEKSPETQPQPAEPAPEPQRPFTDPTGPELTDTPTRKIPTVLSKQNSLRKEKPLQASRSEDTPTATLNTGTPPNPSTSHSTPPWYGPKKKHPVPESPERAERNLGGTTEKGMER